MRKDQRALQLRLLDERQRAFRLARKQKSFHETWLRDVRHALGVPLAEMAGKLGVNRSVILQIERREPKKTVSLNSLERIAASMGCELVYSIVPARKGTLVELAELQAWGKRLSCGE
jgi:transcriptional regulator with XRE-family HTH domain